MVEQFDKKKYLKTYADEIHRRVVRKFKRAQVITNGIDDVWAADLVDMNQLSEHNDNWKYILTIIDCFSRFAWAVPLKDKMGSTILKAFQKISVDSGRKPKRLWVDQGKEFINKEMKKWLTTKGITIYHTYGEHKASIIERFNRTLKTMMWKRLTEEQSDKWVTMLPELLSKYNTSKHSSLGMSPTDASKKENEKDLWTYQYSHSLDLSAIPATTHLKLGDWVRISRIKRTFEKGYTPNWSTEIFQIIGITYTSPPTFTIKDRLGEVVKGSFYEPELQKTKLNEIFLIEKVLKERKTGGKKQFLVKWLGYPEKFNSWVNESDVEGLK